MSDNHAALFMPALAGGGAERVMLTLAEGFVARGLKVDLVVAHASGELLDDIPRDVRLVDLGARRIITSVWPLVRYLRRERPSALLAAMAPTNCVAIWARALGRVSVRVVVSEHSTLSIASAGANSRRARILPALMRRTYPHADAVVAVSQGVADDLAETIGLPRERIEVIYNPVVTDTMLAKSREPLDHPWFQPGEPPVILGVGRLVPAKDFQTLIRAFAKLRETQQARLAILGEGPERESLEDLARQTGFEDDIDMPGFVANPYKYMQAAAVFVLSSRWEGLGNVLVEALACGTPVVSTDCPSGPAEILENGRYGKLAPLGDVDGLAKAVKQVLHEGANDVTYDAMAQACLIEFYLNTAVNHYLDVIKVLGCCHNALSSN